MEKRAVFSEMILEEGADGGVTPEFLLLYQKGILLALKEQGVITDEMVRFCTEALERKNFSGGTADIEKRGGRGL